MKTCFKCQKTLPFECFYKHKMMGDGYLGKCKECTKKDTIENRNKNIDFYRKYDRERGNRQSNNYIKEYREKFPFKINAQTMVNNFIRDGKLFKEPCCICGSNEKIHAHHDDYAKPLNVRWLCAAHHRQWHIKNGEAKNGSTVNIIGQM